ncbi:MAG TPA: metallophosphoesterase family protein [Puia sp.]|nr:metallophosphoesterase family protein [Puia sp.]
MRIAFISDIHANLPALEAVLQGIDAQAPDTIFCLGDLVNQNVWNNEVVELIRQRGIRSVRGNHDNGIALGKKFFKFSYTFPEAKKWGIEAIDYTQRTILPENRVFLGQLPLTIRLLIKQKDRAPFTVLLVHGSPYDIHESLNRFMPKQRFRSILEDSNIDLLVCGNTHCPYHYSFGWEKDGKTIYRHVLNPGSVGRPKDGDWRPCYALVTFDPTRNLSESPDAVQVDFYRISYDLGKAVKAIRHSTLSVYYGSCLITG